MIETDLVFFQVNEFLEFLCYDKYNILEEDLMKIFSLSSLFYFKKNESIQKCLLAQKPLSKCHIGGAANNFLSARLRSFQRKTFYF